MEPFEFCSHSMWFLLQKTRPRRRTHAVAVEHGQVPGHSDLLLSELGGSMGQTGTVGGYVACAPHSDSIPFGHGAWWNDVESQLRVRWGGGWASRMSRMSYRAYWPHLTAVLVGMRGGN